MKYSLGINFLADFVLDKSKLDAIAKEAEKILKKTAPEIEFNAEQFKKELTELGTLVKKVADTPINFDVNLDDKEVDKALKDIISAVNEIDNIDLSDIEKAFDNLDISGVDKAASELQDAFDNFDTKQFTDEITQMAATYEKSVADVTKNLDTQKSALKAMEVSGQKGSEAYKKLQKEIEKTEQELKNLGVSGDKSMNFTEKLAQFGLATQGIQQFADSMGIFTEGFIALDTATATMRTLGAEAAEMAPRLRDAAIVMSQEIPFAAAEIQAAMSDALASGVKGGEDGLKKFAEISAKLAVGGGAELGSVVQGLGATLNAFGESSEAAGQYADYMFNIVNAGVTTIDELNQSLSGVTPTAASMGLAFDKVGGSLALMTQKGVPTASAVTKLNALLLEMAKPTAGITEALGAAGVSLDDFHAMIKNDDLVGALGVLQTGFDKTGKSATAMFSSSEAGAAFNVLMGDVDAFNESLAAVSDTTGSTQYAYDQMASTIAVQTNQLKATMQSLFISFNDMVGPAFAGIVSSAQTLMPVIISLQGAMTLIPFGDIAKKAADWGTAIVSKLVPGLITQVAATEGATAAQTKLNFAVLANPYVLAIAGIAALVVALKGLSEILTVTSEEQKEQVQNQLEVVNAQVEATKKQRDMIASNNELVESFRLQGESAMNNEQLMLRLAAAYPGVIDMNKSYAENLKAVEKASGVTYDANFNLVESFKQQGQSAMQNVELMNKLNAAYPGVIDGSKSYADNLKALQGAATTSSTELSKVDKSLQDLAKQKFQLETQVLKLEVDVAAENLENDLTDSLNSMDWSDWGSYAAGILTMGLSFAVDDNADDAFGKLLSNVGEFFNLGSFGRNAVNDMIGEIKDGMDKATSSDEIAQLGVKMKIAILNNSELSEEDKQKALKGVDALEAAKQKQLEATKNAVLNQYESYKSSGLDEQQIIALLTKEHGKTKAEIEAIVKKQKEQKVAAEQTKDAVKEITDAYSQMKSQMQTNFDSGVLQEIALTNELKKARKAGDTEQIKFLQDKLKEQKKINKENDKELDSMNKNAELISSQYEEKAKEKVDYLALLKEETDRYSKQLDFESKKYDLQLQGEQIDENRAKNEYDEYRLTANALTLQEKKLANYREELFNKKQLATINPDGTIKFNAKLDKEQQQQVLDEIEQMKLDIEQSKLNVISLAGQLTIDMQSIDREVKELELKDLEAQIELGVVDVTNYNDIAKYYQQQGEKLAKEIEGNNSVVTALEKQRDKEIKALNAAADKTQIESIQIKYNSQIKVIKEKNLELRNEETDYYSKSEDLVNKYYESKEKDIENYYSKEKEKISKQFDEQAEIVKKATEDFKSNFVIGIEVDTESSIDNLETEKDARIKALEEAGQSELSIFRDIEAEKTAIEEEYANRRAEIERQANDKKLALDAFVKGIELENSRQSNEAKYSLELEEADKRIALLEEKAKAMTITIDEKNALDELRKSRDTLKTQLDENASVWALAMNQGSQSLQDATTQLISGNGEAAANALKAYFSQIFGVLVEALKTEIKGTVMKLVLEWLTLSAGDPLVKLALAPVMYGIIDAGINAIASPILGAISSFATGGQIDGPTLAVVGDASKLGSDNKEWIFRNDQLKQTMSMVANASSSILEKRLAKLEQTLASQTLETRLSGNDILISLKRSQSSLNRRKI